MVVQENLMGVSQHFFTPDIVSRISEILGQTKDKTLAGLKSVVPAFISGIVEKGSTPEGAATLVDIVKTHHFERSDFSDFPVDEKSMVEGSEVVQNVFGSNLEPTLSRLSAQTKLDRGSLERILGIIAPACMGIVGAKIKRDSLNMTGFMAFIKDQKKLLSGYSHETSEYYSLSGRSPDKDYKKSNERPIWKSWIWGIALAGGLMAWWNAVQYRSPATIRSPVSTVTSAPIALLGDFLENPVRQELPKRFYFDGIYFLGHSTRLAEGFSEINYVAGVLKSHPEAQVHLVGVGENVGTDRETIDFATRRAELVRNELVARGARPEQITIGGLANAGPAGSKATTPGNAQYQRMELVVTGLK